MHFTTVVAAFSNASFTYTQNGHTVAFNDTSTGTNPITGWSWDFGDGETSTVKNPTHTYAANGNFTVILIVGDGFGNYNTTSDLIIINVTIEGQMNGLIAIVVGVVEVVIVMIVVGSIVVRSFKKLFKGFGT
jgi:PKD repeat protein